MATTNLAPPSDFVSKRDQALCAFLAEKERRSASRRTVESYSRMLQHYFGLVGRRPTP